MSTDKREWPKNAVSCPTEGCTHWRFPKFDTCIFCYTADTEGDRQANLRRNSWMDLYNDPFSVTVNK